MLLEEPLVPQDINLTLPLKVSIVEGRKAQVAIPGELRLTPQVFNFVNELVKAQGFELVNLQIAEIHKEEIKDLHNVLLVEPSKQ